MIRTIPYFGNLYLANKMAGIPQFNAPWFDSTAAQIRAVPGVRSVFNPADEDRKYGFEPLKCPEGSPEEAKKLGFDRRKTLGTDWSWIAEMSDGMILGPDWESSTGAISELHCHQALGLPVWEAWVFFSRVKADKAEWLMSPDWQVPTYMQLHAREEVR